MSAYFTPHFLQGRRFLITGATGGVGSRTALEISRVGGICTLVARDGDKAERVLRELHGTGHNTVVLPDAIPAESLPYDGIFHAAGSEVIKPLALSFEVGADEVFKPSVGAAICLLQAAALRNKPLVKDGGSIVFMSSVAATHGQTGMSLYCASKGAIEALTRAAAVELAPRRIRVNAIRAGAFASPMHTRITQGMTEAAIDAYAARHLFGFGKPEDIAHAALFLLGDTGRWITGTCMEVDGGYSCK